MRFIVCLCVCALLPGWRQTYAPPKRGNGLASAEEIGRTRCVIPSGMRLGISNRGLLIS